MYFLKILAYFLYAFVCLLCIRITKNETNSKINLTSVFVLPYLLICTVQEAICIFAGYFLLPGVTYWCINIIFVVVACLLEVCFTNVFRQYQLQSCVHTLIHNRMSRCFNAIIYGFIFMVAVMAIKMASSVNLGLLLQENFQDKFNDSMGGSFYVRLLTIIFAVYIFGINKSKIGYFFGILCFVPHIIVNTKGILFIPIIAILITQIILERIVSLKRTFLLLGSAGIFIFFFSYMFEFFTYGENPLTNLNRWLYIFEKLIVYVCAGVQEFNVNIANAIEHNPNEVNITLTPINNMLAKFYGGNSISSINTEFNNLIGILPHYGKAYSNVNGYIGTLYIFNGLLGGLVFHASLIVLTCILKLISNITQRPFWIILYSLFLSGFFLGWFDFYFMQTFWLYFVILTILLDIFYSIIFRKITNYE